MGTFYTEFVKDKNHPSLKTETKLTFYYLRKSAISKWPSPAPCVEKLNGWEVGVPPWGRPRLGRQHQPGKPSHNTEPRPQPVMCVVSCLLSDVRHLSVCQTSVCLYVCLLSTAIYMLPSVCSTHCSVMSESAVSCCHLCRCLSTTFCHLSIKLSLCQYNVKCLKVDPKMR